MKPDPKCRECRGSGVMRTTREEGGPYGRMITVAEVCDCVTVRLQSIQERPDE